LYLFDHGCIQMASLFFYARIVHHKGHKMPRRKSFLLFSL
jgi:hypothetical protein